MALTTGYLFWKKTILKALGYLMSIDVSASYSLFETTSTKFKFDGRVEVDDPTEAQDVVTKSYLENNNTGVILKKKFTDRTELTSLFENVLPQGYTIKSVFIDATAYTAASISVTLSAEAVSEGYSTTLIGGILNSTIDKIFFVPSNSADNNFDTSINTSFVLPSVISSNEDIDLEIGFGGETCTYDIYFTFEKIIY